MNNIFGLPAMLEVARYSAIGALPDGRRIEFRALRPDDQAGLLAAIDRTSAESLYRRFFGAKRDFSEKERDFFLNIDFINHVALVAVVEEASHPVIIAGGRYVVERPGAAEVAFAVIDEYQGQGIGAVLLRHLTTIARDAGLEQFTAEVLPDNISMLKVFEKSGLKVDKKREAMAVHVTLQL
ncbi:MAG: GNAT family N-acetyltransferase, partial [Pseudolabrys sp.]